MKRIEFIKKAAMAAVLAPFCPSVLEAVPPLRAPAGQSISVSCDGKSWFTEQITQQQLDSAVYNEQTGMKELTLEVELPYTGSPYNLVRTSGQLIGVVNMGSYPQPEIMCEMIIAIIIVIIGGVIIYQLVKLCRSVLNPSKKKDDDNS